MARKAKIPDKVSNRFTRRETSRKQDFRVKRRYYLIVCEGTKTEPNYFEGLKKKLLPGVISTVELEIIGTGHNTMTVVDDAQKERERLEKSSGRIFDEVWAVFDRDDFPEQNFNSAIFQGQKVGIYCAWTNEAFELWYLLHFQYCQDAMLRTAYKARIEHELSRRMGRPYVYQKNSKEMFQLLEEYGNTEQAIIHAKRLEAEFANRTDYANHNPCTKVYELVEKLRFLQSNE